MFKLEQVSYSRSNHVLIHAMSVEFEFGALTMIAGPNGAGKTTLLRLLDGELQPNEGKVFFKGEPVNVWKIKDMARHRAVLPQQGSLDFPFTVYDVIEMGRVAYDSSEKENKRITEQVIDRCDCNALIDRPFTELSGGEQQRVQIARVLCQIWQQQPGDKRFLLLDEPVSALDLSHQYELLRLLKSLCREQGLGIICVLHNLNLAAQFADRCLLIDQGRVVADGLPSEVFTRETLSAVFDLDISIVPHPQNAQVPLVLPDLGQV